MLGSQDQVVFLLVGSAVAVASASGLTVTTATVGERWNGTLPLLVASPSSPLVVLMGRGAAFVVNGLVTSLGALLLVAPLFEVSLRWSRYPVLIVLLVLVTLTTYMAATVLAGLILKTPSLQRTVANVGRLVIMAFCGVTVPREFFPVVVEWISAVLPLTHGLHAIRELYGAARPGVILSSAAREGLVLLGWLAVSLLTFHRLADAGRRDGSIVFSSG
ncbi:MAG: ABC transporter permease [Acidimicrobiia bacterium]